MLNLTPNNLFAQKYRLRRRLGEGGFSEVWLVYNEVAKFEQVIKIYNGVEGEGSEIFRQEFASVYHLSHSNILRATEYAIFDKKPYLVMPYIRGGSILQMLGKVSEKDMAKVMMDIGAALAHIHQPIHALVHKDIKPDNIFIGNIGNYLLGDFGISTKLRRQFKEYAQKRSKLLSTGAGLTPMAYRAPEYFESIKAETDPIMASDIWAFGASLFELATGNQPFHDLGGSAQFSNAEPPDLPIKFSRGLNNVLKQCMAKNPWDRPSAKDLERLGKYYLTYGNWTTQFETFTKPIPSTTGTRTVPGGSSYSRKEDTYIPTLLDNKISKRNNHKKVWLTMLISLIVTLGFAFIAYKNDFFRKPVVVENTTNNATIDSTGVSSIDESNEPKEEPDNDKKNESIVDIEKPQIEEDQSTKPSGEFTDKGSKTNTVNNDPYYFTKFYIQEDPHDAKGICKVKLSSVHLKDNETEIVLHLKGCARINLFSGESPHAFHIKTQGRKYLLNRVKGIRTGKDIYIGSDKKITLLFAPVPTHIRKFDLMEGEDQVAEGGHTFWHFKGVSLKR